VALIASGEKIARMQKRLSRTETLARVPILQDVRMATISGEKRKSVPREIPPSEELRFLPLSCLLSQPTAPCPEYALVAKENT